MGFERVFAFFFPYLPPPFLPFFFTSFLPSFLKVIGSRTRSEWNLTFLLSFFFTSATENLVYIDFDVIHELDVAIYPDSGKIGVWGKEINKVYPQDDNVDYYEGE